MHADFIALCCLTNSLFAGEVNTTLSSRYDVFPENSSRTQDKSRSAELKLEAFHDLDDSRFVAELIGRADADDAGRRILEARQAYLRTPIAGMEAFIGHRQVFWGNAESKNVVDIINQRDAAAAQGSSAKLGAPSLSLERYMNSGDMQLWYINAFRQRTFNDSDAHPSRRWMWGSLLETRLGERWAQESGKWRVRLWGGATVAA